MYNECRHWECLQATNDFPNMSSEVRYLGLKVRLRSAHVCQTSFSTCVRARERKYLVKSEFSNNRTVFLFNFRKTFWREFNRLDDSGYYLS